MYCPSMGIDKMSVNVLSSPARVGIRCPEPPLLQAVRNGHTIISRSGAVQDRVPGSVAKQDKVRSNRERIRFSTSLLLRLVVRSHSQPFPLRGTLRWWVDNSLEMGIQGGSATKAAIGHKDHASIGDSLDRQHSI